MNSLPLPPEQFWFYRVLIEWTLGILHRVNNELTGALFLLEQLQESCSSPDTSSPSSQELCTSLAASLQKILVLISEAAALHTPASQQISDPITPSIALREASTLARLLLPKSIKILEPPSPPPSNPYLLTPLAEFRLLAAAAALLLHPHSFRAKGSLSLRLDTPPSNSLCLLSFQIQLDPSHPLPTPQEPLSPNSKAFQALLHRISAQGGSADLLSPNELALSLPASSSHPLSLPQTYHTCPIS